MQPSVRALEDRDIEAVVDLSLRAWAPVFTSLERVLAGSGVYEQLHPDWQVGQRDAVEAACRSESVTVWVAEASGAVIGFVAVQLRPEPGIGEIYMVAVDPDRQRQGVATALTSFALKWVKERGMAIAMVETGGDPGHAPARATYEKVGFTALPVTRYFKKL